MNSRNMMIGGAAIVLAVSSYMLGMQHSKQQDEVALQSKERKVLYWYDPMNPGPHFDKPGKSPFMDMQLVPRYADEASEDRNIIHIDARVAQNLGVRVVTVERSSMKSSLEAAGTIAFNQREVSIVQSRANGFVSHAYAHAPGDIIKQDEALADIVVPEWASAQGEYLALLQSRDQQLIDAALSRLKLLGMPTEVIAGIEQSHQVSNTVSIRAPRAGMIESLDVRDGMTVNVGASLATIYGLQTMWLDVALPESQSAFVSAGQPVSAQAIAYPQLAFKGKISAILPDTNAETHTLRVRVELDNASAKLRPGMFARVRFEQASDKPVLNVPSEAIIRSGIRNIVLRHVDGGYEPIEVQLGKEANGRTEILSGVEAGQSVVASGQFLIDSEANLNGALDRLRPINSNDQPSQGPSSQVHSTQGNGP